MENNTQPAGSEKPKPEKKTDKVRFGLRWQFVIIISVLILLITGILSMIILNQEKNALTATVTKQGIIYARNLVSVAKEAIPTEDELTIFSAINDISKEKWVTNVFLLDPDGYVIAHKDPLQQGQKFNLETYKVHEKDGEFIPGKLKIDGLTVFDFAIPVYVTFPEKTLLAYAHILINTKAVTEPVTAARNTAIVIIIIFILLGIAGSFIISGLITNPVQKITRGAQIIGQGNLDHKIELKRKDEFGLLSNEFNRMTTELARAQSLLLEQQRLEYELNIATDIQHSLLPSVMPAMEGFDFGAYYNSAKEVGGDYYDFFPIDENKLGMVIADVSGKGVPGSMVMVMTRSILKSQAQMGLSALQTLIRTNAILYEDMKPGMFVTAFYGILDKRDHSVEFAIAGHDPMIIYRTSEKKIQTAKTEGFALGVKKTKFFARALKAGKITLEKDDMMIQYTDGIPEAMNINREEFGMDRFHKAVSAYGHLPCKEFIEKLNSDISDFVGEAEQFDDIAIITVKAI